MEGCSLGHILSNFLEMITHEVEGAENSSPILDSLVGIYRNISFSDPLSPYVYRFELDDESTSHAIKTFKQSLDCQGVGGMARLNSPITYLLDELICNIQQHANTDHGYAYVGFDKSSNFIEIVIADCGITIYGSYAFAQKYIELIGNSDALALNLARNGYSTKNLPDAENRGYGISSNIQMVVEGLHGEFAVLSGNALLVQLENMKKILSLPKEIDFKGTMVIVRFPASIPDDFNLYNYTN